MVLKSQRTLLLPILALLGPASGAAALAAPAARHLSTAKNDELPRLRVVLRGVLYRSGSPSEQGLTHLCRDRWQRVYSLYGDRTYMRGPRNQAMSQKGYDERRCTGPDDQGYVLRWQASPASNRARTLPNVFRDVLAAVRDPHKGPVLVHCWNGLHSAGMIAAMALRQFCGLSPEEGANYWIATSHNPESYPNLIQHVRDFRPLPGFALTEAERRRVCPDVRKGTEWRNVLTAIPPRQASATTTAMQPRPSAPSL